MSKKLSVALRELAKWEKDREAFEEQLELERQRRLAPLYRKRSELIDSIDGFWKIVLTQHDDFAKYIRAVDFILVEAIRKIDVTWTGPRSSDFTIRFVFDGIDGHFKAQTVEKKFWVGDEGRLLSKPVALEFRDSYRGTFLKWFLWTKQGDEFEQGEELARLFSEELYQYCERYYTEAQMDVAEEDMY